MVNKKIHKSSFHKSLGTKLQYKILSKTPFTRVLEGKEEKTVP